MPQFTPVEGTLTSVMFELNGVVEGTVSGRTLSDVPVATTLRSQAEINATFEGRTLASVNPTGLQTVRLAAFEGGDLFDFSGSDAVENLAISGSASDSRTFTTDLEPFIGTGDISVDVDAEGSSGTPFAVSFLIGSLSTEAGAQATITYMFDEPETVTPIPLPAAGWALLSVIGALWAFRRRPTA